MTNKRKSSAKSVTAPLAYNPGKGRPKEHLAYLNYQEMQALKRLNGNNQERGPRGLPSFPPADATSGSYNSGYGSGGSKPSSGGPRSGVSGSVSPSSGSPRGSNPPSGGGGSNSGSRPSGGMMGGTGSGGSSRTSPSVGSGNKGNVGGMRSGPGSTGGYKTPGAGGSNADRAAINAANKANTLSAQKAPAFKADTGRTVNVGPMGTPVNVNAPPGGKIKGAIQGVKAAQTVSRGVAVPTATVQSPMATQGTSFASPLDARIENFQRINDARIRAGALGPEGVPSVSQITAENASRLNAAKMAQQYSQYRSPPRGYPAAPQGVYGPRAGVGTGYLGTADMPGMITTGMTSPYSGTIKPRFNAAQTLMAYEAEKRVPGKIQDRVPPTERFRPSPTTPSGRIATPGLISYPNLDRPMTNEEAIKQYSSFRNPTAVPVSRPRTISVPSPEQSLYTGAGQFTAPTGKKQFYDRINVLPSPEQSLYIGKPGKTRGIGDVQLPQSQYSGYGAEGYSNLSGIPTPESSGLLPTQYPDYRPPSRSSYPNYGPPSMSFAPSQEGVPEEAIPGFGIDPDNIPRGLVPGANEVEQPTNITGPWLGQSAIRPNPPVYKEGKLFTDPVLDRIAPEEPAPSIDEPPRFMRDVDAPPYAGTQGIASLQPQSPSKITPGMSRVTNIFAANPRTISEDLRKQITEGYESFRPKEDSYGLVGEEAADAAKKAGFPRNVYTNEDFLGNPDQLGLTREEVAVPLSPDDMAKVVNRSRALRYDDVKPYLTGPEKVRAKVSDVVERIVTFGAPAKLAVGTAKKLMSIESPEKFLSRPSYEQQALYEYAREANTRYRPGADGVPQVGEPGDSGTVGGGSKFGRDGLGGSDRGNSGIASLGPKPKGDETTTPTPDTPSTSPGRRPDIYYMWDLGINIPSPSDPNYNQYQTYLAERLAAQRAMGYV